MMCEPHVDPLVGCADAPGGLEHASHEQADSDRKRGDHRQAREDHDHEDDRRTTLPEGCGKTVCHAAAAAVENGRVEAAGAIARVGNMASPRFHFCNHGYALPELRNR